MSLVLIIVCFKLLSDRVKIAFIAQYRCIIFLHLYSVKKLK